MNEFQPAFDQLYCERVKRARSMTPEERIVEGFRLTEGYMRSIVAMSEEERQRWRQERAREEDQFFGPPIPISEILRAERRAD